MTQELRRAWIATVMWFALNAFGFASFVVRFPEIKSELGLSNSGLGLTLFVASLGALGAIKLAGAWSAKHGSAPVMVWSAVVASLLFPVLGSMINLGVFAAILFSLFLCISIMDIAMNAHAVTIEQQSGKMIMGRLHAMWSVGGIVGGFGGGLFASQSLSLFVHSLIISGLMLVLVFGFRHMLLPASADIHEPVEEHHQEKTKRPRIFYLLGFIGLCAAIMEGSAADWGAVLVSDEYGATGFTASLPYIVFQTGMVIGRVNGDAVAAKFGRSKILFFSGLTAAVGLFSGLAIGGVGPVIFAWLCLGLGASVVIPMAFSLAGSIATNEYAGRIAPSQAVATVSGIAYAAFFIGPPLIGLVADATSLRYAMLIPATLALGVAFGSRVLKGK